MNIWPLNRTPKIETISTAIVNSFEQTLSSIGRVWSMTEYWPPNPDEIINKKGIDIYDQMQTDATVLAALRSKSNAISAMDWDIKPASNDPGDVNIATMVRWNIDNFTGSTKDVIENILDAVPKGFSIQEPVYKVQKKGPYDGFVVWDYFAPKNPKDFQFTLDDFGRVKELVNYTQTGDTLRFDPKDFVIFSYQGRYRLPWGRSDLRAAYKHWWSKDFLERWWNVFNQVYAMPTRYAKIPRDAYYDETRKKQILDALKSMANNTTFWVPDDISVEVIQVATGTVTYGDAIRHHNDEIAKAILGSSLTMEKSQGQLGGGSELGKVHGETKQDFVAALAADVEQVFFEQMIKPLVDLNYSVWSYPKFRFVKESDRVKLYQAADIVALVQCGVARLDEDINDLRQRVSLAPLTDETIQTMIEEKKKKDELAAAKLLEPPAPAAAPVTAGLDNKSRGDIPPPPAPPAPPKPEPAAHAAPAKRGPFWREQTPAELRCNMYSRLATLDRGERDILDALRPIVEKMRDNLLTYIGKNVFADGKADFAAVEDMKLSFVNQFRSVLSEKFAELFRQAVNSGARAVDITPKQFEYVSEYVSVKLDATARPPVTELAKLKQWQSEGNQEKIKAWRTGRLTELEKKSQQRAFWITGVESNKILDAVKSTIYTGLDNNETTKTITGRVGRVFENYIARGENVPAELMNAPRLESIVRTNITRLFAETHKELAQDPLIAEDFPGMQYTAIMDDVVCDECAELDGEIYPSDDPIWDRITPPMHDRCRCDIVPVPASEIKEFDSPNTAREVLTNISPSFGGSKGE